MSIELAALAAAAATATSVAAISGWSGRAPVSETRLQRTVFCKTGDRVVASCVIRCDAAPDMTRAGTARAAARQWGDRLGGRLAAILQHAVSDAAEGFDSHALLDDPEAFLELCRHILTTEFQPLGLRVAHFELKEVRLLKSLARPIQSEGPNANPALAA